ncbi:hypothetical protein EPUS_05327 [Endocarpon pusillum Z07020]|uniref:Clr5 domain-containing protein n=1 Tax=Endocarpon pusillum (strain Z07020 / HMAS-L-300199) TaxID=1263415 RepID=U1HLW9_ENDPU|nr:uncharacterized protein EPUS_05327 [Endocarpon pusillum Z07020]ERF71275.1 hypothetical protein EPUS_05327 [Endocarpon pusillum Z07020]
MASQISPAVISTSSHSKRARRIPDNEWDIWRPKLEQLFIEDGISRKDIVGIMTKSHGFDITEVQLKRRFEKWGVKKYIPENDLKTMIYIKRKRQENGEDSRFQWRGHDVEQERIERASKRIKGPLNSPEMTPTHIKIYTSQHQKPQSVLSKSSSEHATGDSFALPDIDVPLHEPDCASGDLDFEFNDVIDFGFDLRFISEGFSHNDSTPTDYNLNDFIVRDAPTLTPKQLDQRSLSGDLYNWKSLLAEPFISEDSAQAISRPESAFEDIGSENLTKPLVLIEESFFAELSKMSNNQSSGISEDITEWVASEFRNSLAASYEASALGTRKRLKSKTDEPSWTPLTQNRFLGAIMTQKATSFSTNIAQKLRSLQISSKTCSLQDIPVGRLLIKLMVFASQGTSTTTTASFTFTPNDAICKKGVSATLLRAFDSLGSPTIARSITSFNIIPRNHPIVTALEHNDIRKVQELFSSKQASPNDRIPNGTSLLPFANQSVEMTQLLLREGATTGDCFRQVFIRDYASPVGRPPGEFDFFRRISDIALEAGASVDDCDDPDPLSPVYDGIFHRLVWHTLYPGRNAFVSELPQLVAYFVKIGFSIEALNSDGETPFLNAASSRGICLTFLQILLEHGANPTAKDKWGRGALHLAVCGYWADDDDGDDDDGDDDDDGWDGSDNDLVLTSRNQDEVRGVKQLPNTDVEESLLEKLLFLLQAGCDPEGDHNGLTVCYYAKRCSLSSTWHAALSTFNAERRGTETQG